MSSLVLLACPMFCGQEMALRQRAVYVYSRAPLIYMGTVSAEKACGATDASAPPSKPVSRLGSLPRLWPTSFVVCYVVGFLRLLSKPAGAGSQKDADKMLA